eukprot:gb/GFBE01020218.1/.p1 GENE.gb/GFBE01020218.1/~~gb/GFBE01020218.1/.p1  ORF type:complete len:499 (+),score=72.80 gb/GFBE01020218.1/:1-1497(+)
MVLLGEVAQVLFSSLKFCFLSSVELAKLADSADTGKVGPELFSSVASRLRELAELDSGVLESLTRAHAKTSTASWWLLANLAVGTTALTAMQAPCPFGLSWTLPLLAVVNALAILAKTSGTTFRHLSANGLQSYLANQCRLLIAAAMLVMPLLAFNLVVWLLVHGVLGIFVHLLPDVLTEPLPQSWFGFLDLAATTYWFFIKTVMLIEVLVNHEVYRSVLARRRSSSQPLLSFHVADALFGYSYTILAFTLAWTTLRTILRVGLAVAPRSWSPVGIILLLVVRASWNSLATKGKAALYFSVHRLLHVQPFYTCWHKEHHFSASQTCLTACQESGLLESAFEALYVQLVFLLVPFFDNCAYVWSSTFNSLHHHYYEEYKHVHWKVVKHMMLFQRHVRALLSKLELVSVPDSILAENLQYPSADFKSPHLGLGSIENAWHGRHHWTTQRLFGYGTYDCISNLGSDVAIDAAKREADITAFLNEYVGVITKTIQITSLVNK